MSRGGDTPQQETLFAVEFESGKFAFGHADEDELFVATKDGLAQIWYADANGVITGNTPNADNVASAIIDDYNEHFGTDIQIWTPETITLQVGGTVPNWNAFEKMSSVRYAIAYSGDLSVFGVVENTTFKVSCNGENFYLIDGITGEIYSQQYYGSDFINMLISKLNAAGVNVSTVERNSVSYEIGSTVPDWYLYKLIR